MYYNPSIMHVTNTDLSSYTHSIFIPFIYKFSPKHVPQVWCTVEGVDIKMPVDTGSTGTLIGAPILPNVPSTAGTPAHHFFTSSKILYVGRQVELAMEFSGEGGSFATATVPVLIVDKSWKCPWYNPTVDRFECPPGPGGEQAIERDTSQITYMGIGFGRNGLKDGMPYATPSVNPMLNLHAIDGEPVPHGSMRAGYIVSREGVQIGLTPKSTREFVFTDLDPGLNHAEDKRDWAMARMCFSINGEGRNCGTVLVDTGIAQMYIRTDKGISMPTVIIPNPNPNGHAKMVKRVKPGTKITIGFPSLDHPAMSYSFAVGGASAIEPNYVFPQLPEHPPYVNTGRNLLFGYSIAFDAVGGRFGFRSTGNSGAASVL
ncbi:outer membrane autotransporter barrel protein [Stemphylium lycopersici]|nr:outer membrane autotransporter barrel protein [Stemphylium lycopersici]